MTDTPTPDATPTDVPATFYLLNGKQFVVEGVGEWQYLPQGIFASGKFLGEHKHRDVLIPYDRVDFIDLDFPTLKQHMAQQQTRAKLTIVGDTCES